MGKTPLFRILKRAARETQPSIERSAGGMDRRQFLQTMAGAALAAAPMSQWMIHSALARPLTKLKKLKENDFINSDPVIILGGGVAGLTAAYRLLQARVKCEIYEASSRLGGRIFTQDRFNSEGMFCELGGELIDSEHEDLIQLAQEFGLKLDDLSIGDAEVERWVFYFGGKRSFEKDLIPAFAPLAAHLKRDIAQVAPNPSQPVNYRFHNPFAQKLDQMSMKEYLYSKKDVDKWVLDLVNVAYLGEFGLETEEQSAINLMLLHPRVDEHFQMFGGSDEGFRIHGGNCRLIEALEKAILRNGKIHRDRALVKIRRAGANLELTLRSRDGMTQVRKASQVICAIPFPVLRNVEGIATLGLSPRKLEAIQRLGYGTNAKASLGFKSKVWRKKDLGFPPSRAYSFMDLPSQCFWETSRAQPGSSGILTNFLGGKAGATASGSVRQTATQDLEKLFPGTTAALDGCYSLFRWIDYGYSYGSYTCPKVGQVTTLIGCPGEPELGGQLLFAGEHVSEVYQGYMNGAVQSGNLAAKMVVASKRMKMTVMPTGQTLGAS